MDRRSAIMTLSGALASTLAAQAFAQTTTQPATAQPAAGTTLAPGAYKQQTLDIGAFSKMTSELALARATHPKVKQFAQFEVAEQTTVAQVLTDSANPSPPPLDPQHTALLRQLQGQTGKAFDVAYVQGQIAGHRELLNIQQALLNGTPTSRDEEHIAMLARTVIMMHLTMLQDLQGGLSA
jgi:predicted outer membrane protein